MKIIGSTTATPGSNSKIRAFYKSDSWGGKKHSHYEYELTNRCSWGPNQIIDNLKNLNFGIEDFQISRQSL